jgi:methyl-accepting chemotaxis protein
MHMTNALAPTRGHRFLHILKDWVVLLLLVIVSATAGYFRGTGESAAAMTAMRADYESRLGKLSGTVSLLTQAIGKQLPEFREQLAKTSIQVDSMNKGLQTMAAIAENASKDAAKAITNGNKMAKALKDTAGSVDRVTVNATRAAAKADVAATKVEKAADTITDAITKPVPTGPAYEPQTGGQ